MSMTCMPKDSTPSCARARLNEPEKTASMSSMRLRVKSAGMWASDRLVNTPLAIPRQPASAQISTIVRSMQRGRGVQSRGANEGRAHSLDDPRSRRRPCVAGGLGGADDRLAGERDADEQERLVRALRLEGGA